MSNYLARLKEIENEKKINISSANELTKLTEMPFDGFVSSNPVGIIKISDIASKESLQIKMIQGWLRKIGEPESEHYLVLDKCRADSEAMQYFLKHAEGKLEEVKMIEAN